MFFVDRVEKKLEFYVMGLGYELSIMFKSKSVGLVYYV